MNTIQFTDNGFNLVYPDRTEKWIKTKENDLITGLSFIKYKGYIYIQKT